MGRGAQPGRRRPRGRQSKQVKQAEAAPGGRAAATHPWSARSTGSRGGRACRSGVKPGQRRFRPVRAQTGWTGQTRRPARLRGGKGGERGGELGQLAGWRQGIGGQAAKRSPPPPPPPPQPQQPSMTTQQRGLTRGVQGEVEVVVQVGADVVVHRQLHAKAVAIVEHHEPGAVVLDRRHHLQVGLGLVLLASLAQCGVVACGVGGGGGGGGSGAGWWVRAGGGCCEPASHAGVPVRMREPAALPPA